MTWLKRSGLSHKIRMTRTYNWKGDRLMTKTKLNQLADLGQSVWLDYMHRSLINSGELQAYVDKGLRGITSNPTIFEKAIAESDIYDDQIHKLAVEGRSPQEIYEKLTVEDSRM